MYENIYEALEEWNYALLFEDKEREREAGRKIEEFKRAYREGKLKKEKVKIVGVFDGDLCSVYKNNSLFAHIWHLKYTGVAEEDGGMRLYTNEDTHIWLDYAVYE